jgi:hypothetical protein
MIDIGVAKPKAQGHATISTDTALITARASAGGGPQIAQAAKDRIETPTTEGTKYPEMRSAIFWIGALDRWASLTIRTI